MKILRVFSGVPFIQECEDFFSISNLSQEDVSYAAAIESFKNNDLYYRYSFVKCFKQLNYDCLEIMLDVRSLQKKWCMENHQKVDFSQINWLMSVFEKQLELFKPEIIFFDRSSSYLPFYYIDKKTLKKKYPFIKILSGFWGSSLIKGAPDYESSKKLISNVDILFCQDRSLMEIEKKVSGIKTYLLPHCFDISLSILNSLSCEKKHEFTFLGTSGYRTPDHKHRYHFLHSLLKKGLIEAWLKESIEFSDKKSINVGKKILKILLRKEKAKEKFERYWRNKHPLTHKFSNKIDQYLIGYDYYEKLSQSKITFNIHSDLPGHIGNMRCYEATGVQSCMLVDKPHLIKDLFKPDEEVVCYSSVSEAVEKIRFLLDNSKKAEEIALKGHKRTLNEHNMMNRVIEMDNIFRTYIS